MKATVMRCTASNTRTILVLFGLLDAVLVGRFAGEIGWPGQVFGGDLVWWGADREAASGISRYGHPLLPCLL
jgi:hypothetical protein